MGKKGRNSCFQDGKRITKRAQPYFSEFSQDLRSARDAAYYKAAPIFRGTPPRYSYDKALRHLINRYDEDISNRRNATMFVPMMPKTKAPLCHDEEDKFQRRILAYVYGISDSIDNDSFGTLQRQCLEIISQNVSSYPPDVLAFALATLTSKKIQLFNFLCAVHNSVNDSTFPMSIQGRMSRVYFSASTTADSIQSAGEQLLNISRKAFDEIESWEELHDLAVGTLDPRADVESVAFFGSQLSLQSFSLLARQFAKLSSIFFINTSMNKVDSSYWVEEGALLTRSHIIANAIISAKLDRLEELNFIGCSWCTPVFLRIFASLMMSEIRCGPEGTDRLPSLAIISVLCRDCAEWPESTVAELSSAFASLNVVVTIGRLNDVSQCTDES